MNNTPDTKTLEVWNECRRLMAERLTPILASVMDEADDLLFDLSRRGRPEDHPFYFTAMREVRRKRSEIESLFRDSLAGVSAGVGLSTASTDGAQESGDAGNIDPEESLATQNTAGKIRQCCHQALMSLDMHMSDLLRDVPTDKRHNPVAPEQICQRLRDACRGIESGIEVKLILYKLFERYAAAGLKDIYSDLDALIAAQAASGLRADPVVPPAAPAPATAAAAAAAASREREYHMVAIKYVRSQIREHLGNGPVPQFLHDFFHNYWNRLLLKIYQRDGSGQETNAWKQAIQVIDDVIRYTSRTSNPVSRNASIARMPDVIQRLKYGMNVIPVPAEIRARFLAELERYHSAQLGQQVAQPDEDADQAIEVDEAITQPNYHARSTTGTTPVGIHPEPAREPGTGTADSEQPDDGSGSEDVAPPVKWSEPATPALVKSWPGPTTADPGLSTDLPDLAVPGSEGAKEESFSRPFFVPFRDELLK